MTTYCTKNIPQRCLKFQENTGGAIDIFFKLGGVYLIIYQNINDLIYQPGHMVNKLLLKLRKS